MADKTDFAWVKIKEDTVQSYTWIIYCDDDAGTNLSTEFKKTSKYIGLRFNNVIPQDQGGADATDITKYQMIKVVGEDGVDAVENHTWIRYADDRQGHRLSKRFKHQPYIAFGFNKKTRKSGNDPHDYQYVRTGEIDLHKVNLFSLPLKNLTNLGKARFKRNSTFRQVSFDSTKIIKELQINDPCLDNRTGFLLIHGSYRNIFKESDLSDYRGFKKSKSTKVDAEIKNGYGFILENSGDNLSEKKVSLKEQYSPVKDKPYTLSFNFDILGDGDGLPSELELDDGSKVNVRFSHYGLKVSEIRRIGRGVKVDINSRYQNLIKGEIFNIDSVSKPADVKDKAFSYIPGNSKFGYPEIDDLAIGMKYLDKFPLDVLIEMPCYFEITDGDKKGQIISDEGCGSGVKTIDAKNKIIVKGMQVTNTYIPMPFTLNSDNVKPAYLYIPLKDILIPSIKERLSISFDLISPYASGDEKSNYTIMYLTKATDVDSFDLLKTPIALLRNGADLVLRTNLGSVFLKDVDANPHRISIIYSLNLIRLTIDNDRFDFLTPKTFIHTDKNEAKRLNEKYDRTYADSILYADLVEQNIMFNANTTKGEYHQAWYGLSNIAVELIGDR